MSQAALYEVMHSKLVLLLLETGTQRVQETQGGEDVGGGGDSLDANLQRMPLALLERDTASADSVFGATVHGKGFDGIAKLVCMYKCICI